MKTIILLCAMFLSNISVFAQNNQHNERKAYIHKTTFYGEFILSFIIVENDRIVDHPSFRIKYNKKGLEKIVKKNFVPYTNSKVPYTNDGNIYINREEYYTTENFNNYLYEKFKVNEEASFFTKTSHFKKETYLMACPDFFEMTNKERLQYFLNHVEK